MHVYLDNAATTPLSEEVLDAMLPYLKNAFGNPSSIHFHGRETKAAIEKARKTVAGILNAAPAEIFFTSGGTEADNMALKSSVYSLGIKTIITSPLEHHAVLHTAEDLHRRGLVNLHLIGVDNKGVPDYEELEQLLIGHRHVLVSLMHANNEIGNLNDLERIGELCHKYHALFHSDTVQTVGHYKIDLQHLKLDYIAGSAHKFHGPKGTGFIYINSKRLISPFINGGAQERNMRGGTENVAGIIGIAKALEIADKNRTEDQKYILSLKERMISRLKNQIEGLQFNGLSAETDKSLYTVLNLSLPPSDISEMLVFNLDINKVSASGGSACASGTNIGSHVLAAINTDPDRGYVRFSFSKLNTPEEIDFAADKLSEMYKNK